MGPVTPSHKVETSVMPEADPVRLAVIGAGNRGQHVYARWCARHPRLARVVAVADPDPARRVSLAEAHDIHASRRHETWQTLLDDLDEIDGLILSTPDRLHVEPAVAALEAGADILLEKPIAPDASGIDALLGAARRSHGSITVAHVLRYTPFFRTLKGLITEEVIGPLVAIDHTENVGYWHFAHSYVRGNWRREADATPMILAKACHDLDLLRWMVDAPCVSVVSAGRLAHFRSDNAPDGAPPYCLDGCPAEATCPYHAARFYVERLAGWDGWPVSVLSADTSTEGRLAALRDGPYGRCVYKSDNDVADHQVVICNFASGVIATLTVSAFTERSTRTVRLFGGHGEIWGDLDRGQITIRRFLHDHEVIQVGSERVETPLGTTVGHAGGDDGVMRAFARGLQRPRADEAPGETFTSLEESVESHHMAFAAERSRLDGRVVDLALR